MGRKSYIPLPPTPSLRQKKLMPLLCSYVLHQLTKSSDLLSQYAGLNRPQTTLLAKFSSPTVLLRAMRRTYSNVVQRQARILTPAR